MSSKPRAMFPAGDIVLLAADHSGMDGLMTADERSRAAFGRLQELLADMGWDDDMAEREFYVLVAKPLKQSKKSVQAWFSRESIPVHMIFNVAAVLSVKVDWLAALPNASKGSTDGDSGLYYREVKREEKRHAPRQRQRA